jgi:hypothetical protein
LQVFLTAYREMSLANLVGIVLINLEVTRIKSQSRVYKDKVHELNSVLQLRLESTCLRNSDVLLLDIVK